MGKERTNDKNFETPENRIEWDFLQLVKFFENDPEALDTLCSLLEKLNARNVHPERWSVKLKGDSVFRPALSF